jgi:DNA-binding MarR family transcriptional regulator
VRRAEPRVSYVVGRLNRALSLAIEERVAKHGLTLSQYTALSILRVRSGLSNAQLARRGFVRPQSMMQVTSALEARRLIVRTPDASHGRVLKTAITPEGRRILAACDRAVTEMETEMLAGLDEQQVDQLRETLLACVHRLGPGHDGR